MNITDINFAIDLLMHPQAGDESDINTALDMAIRALKVWREIIEELKEDTIFDNVELLSKDIINRYKENEEEIEQDIMIAIKSLGLSYILDKIKVEMVQNAHTIVSEYNAIGEGMSLREILQIIDRYKESEW